MTTTIGQQPIIGPSGGLKSQQLAANTLGLAAGGAHRHSSNEHLGHEEPPTMSRCERPAERLATVAIISLCLCLVHLPPTLGLLETNALDISQIQATPQAPYDPTNHHELPAEDIDLSSFDDHNGIDASHLAMPQIELPTPEDLIEKLSPLHNIEPDAHLDPPGFLRARHFIPESHHVITKDNYILTLHRIVNPLVPPRLRSKLKPVLLQHGLFTSSFNYLIISDRKLDRPRFDPRDITRTWPLHVYTPQAPFSWQRLLETMNDAGLAKLGLSRNSDHIRAPHLSDSLAIELANQGYDVWLANSRGSTYSLNHTHLDHRSDWRYWDFSFHEIGLLDLPAQIDYILAHRARRSLAYVGHSQGNLAMFILQSFHPEWSHKVKPFIAVAPVAFIPSAYFGALRLFIKALSPIVTPRRLNELIKGQIFPSDPATGRALDLVCLPKWSTPVCNIVLDLLLGDNFIRTNDSLIALLAHHIPAGTSIRNILHYAQLVESGQFQAFDFGPRENLRRYGSLVSPFYPIWNINSTDIALIVGRTDPISTRDNVAITRKMLRVPLMDDYVVPDPFWGHSDHMYASGSGLQVNSHLIGLVDRYRLVDS